MEGNDKYSREYRRHERKIFELLNNDRWIFPVHTRDFDLKMIDSAVEYLFRNS